jgi:hypothetical protein
MTSAREQFSSSEPSSSATPMTGEVGIPRGMLMQKCDRILQDHGPSFAVRSPLQTRREPARVHLVVVFDAERDRQPRTQHRFETASPHRTLSGSTVSPLAS